MRRIQTLLVFASLQALACGQADAHNGALDKNGCHYEAATGKYHCHTETRDLEPNPEVNAPVKKSRENVCHDKSSSNYKTIKYFISYKTMSACLTSGGRAAG
jgi:hypothetical protein